ncbi:MAG: PAS domain-containing protein [Gemmatimonadota bacterium]
MISSRSSDEEGFFRLAFLHSSIGVSVVDGDGRILTVNPACAELLGYQPEELVGRDFIQVIYPADREATRNAVAYVLAGGSDGYRLEKRVEHRSGKPVEVLISGTAVRDPSGEALYLVGQMVDFTHQKALEERLRIAEERWSFALEAADHGVWDWEPQTGRLFRSVGWLRLLGYPDDQGVSTVDVWKELVHPDDHPRVAQALQEHLEGGTEAYGAEYRIRAADGNYRWVRDQGQVMTWTKEGLPSRVIGTITDITMQREMASRIQEGSLWEVSRRLTAGFSHEFNNILTVIMGAVGELELTRARGSSEGMDELLGSIHSAAERGRNLTGELLSYACAERLDPRPLDVNGLIHALRPRILAPGRTDVDLQLDLEEALPAVRLDGSRFRTALIHLTDNAQDALPQGGTVTIRTRAFTAPLARGAWNVDGSENGELEGRYVSVTVEDDGVGIPAELIARVFDPFFTTAEVGTASGLGLSMVQGFVRQSEGEVTLESQPGQGSRVTLYFPVAGEVRPGEEA